jgi:dipeptide/tripeptide permease
MTQATATHSSDTSFFGHPRGLATLFFTEMWERFTYYGMRALLILFMTAKIQDGGFGLGAETAAPIYAMYVALAYLATVPGGWLADNFLGQRRSVLIGGIMIALGNALLIFHGLPNFFAGLGCIVVGVGLLKPNISVIVGQLYRPEDKRRDAGFSIFYMGINLGAGVSPLLCGWLAQSDAFKRILGGWGFEPTSSWHWGFGAGAAGMTLGLVQYLATGRHLGSAGLHPTPPATPEIARRNRRTLWIGISAAVAIALGLFFFDRTARYYDSIRWEALGDGYMVEASSSDGSERAVRLRDGTAIPAGELGGVIGSDALRALQHDVFRRSVAAGRAAGTSGGAFLRISDPAASVEGAPAAEIRLMGLRWVDVPGGVRVWGQRVDDPTQEVELGELSAAALDAAPPERLADAVEPILASVTEAASKDASTAGKAGGLRVKVGGLNASNVNSGFTIALLLIVVFSFGRLFLAGDWNASERARLITIFVLFCGASIFWGIFEQAGSTLTLFADRSTRNVVPLIDYHFPSSWWQSANAALIVLLAPLFAWLWLRLGKRDPSYPTKFGVGLVFAGLGFALLVGGATLAKGGREVSPLWLLGVYLLHTIGELCLSPVGLSSMTKLAPARVVSLMMGVWFLAAAVGNFIGGSVAGYYERFELPTLFGAVAASGFAMALVMFALVIPIQRMMARAAAESPAGAKTS